MDTSKKIKELEQRIKDLEARPQMTTIIVMPAMPSYVPPPYAPCYPWKSPIQPYQPWWTWTTNSSSGGALQAPLTIGVIS